MIKLSKDKTQATIPDGSGQIVIKVGQSIDYQSASEQGVTSIGKILEFKYAGYRQSDTSSPWAKVADVVDPAKTEWISLNNWAATPIPKTVNEDHGSEEPDEEDLPF